MPTAVKPLRAQKEFEDEKYFSESGSASEDEGPEEQNEEDDSEDDMDEDGDINMDNVESDDEPEDIQTSLRTVDFGTLADAQSSLDRDRRRNQQSTNTRNSRTDAEKVNTIRARLAELKALKTKPGDKSTTKEDFARSTTSSRTRASMNPLNDAPHARSSKHAPREQSSKYQVTRKRAVIDLPSNPTNTRDPRFSSGYKSAATAPDPESVALKRNYSFLDDYRSTEIQTLKDELSALKSRAHKRKSRSMLPEEEVTAARLKVAINRHENRVKAEKDKERSTEVVRKHKKEEREAVAQGKKPFYLKESEVRKRALTEKFGEMKAKERDRAVKRRTKKISERERRSMPGERRI